MISRGKKSVCGLVLFFFLHEQSHLCTGAKRAAGGWGLSKVN